MKLLLYCTKGKPYLFPMKENKPFELNSKCSKYGSLNGKIVGECDYEVEEIETLHNSFMTLMHTKTLSEKNLLKNSCLTFDELDNYLKKKCGYAIHIKNLKIFGEPRELKDFEKILGRYEFESERCDFCSKDSCENCRCHYLLADLDKAPQNMMYVFDGEEKKVLISIHPEHLCKELNGEKETEVRKIVLKEML